MQMIISLGSGQKVPAWVVSPSQLKIGAPPIHEDHLTVARNVFVIFFPEFPSSSLFSLSSFFSSMSGGLLIRDVDFLLTPKIVNLWGQLSIMSCHYPLSPSVHRWPPDPKSPPRLGYNSIVLQGLEMWGHRQCQSSRPWRLKAKCGSANDVCRKGKLIILCRLYVVLMMFLYDALCTMMYYVLGIMYYIMYVNKYIYIYCIMYTYKKYVCMNVCMYVSMQCMECM